MDLKGFSLLFKFIRKYWKTGSVYFSFVACINRKRFYTT